MIISWFREGLHPLGAWCDNTDEPLAGMLRPGSAGSFLLLIVQDAPMSTAG